MAPNGFTTLMTKLIVSLSRALKEEEENHQFGESYENVTFFLNTQFFKMIVQLKTGLILNEQTCVPIKMPEIVNHNENIKHWIFINLCNKILQLWEHNHWSIMKN